MQHTGVAESYELGVPHLQLGELIGGGGFARVFHGYDSLLRRHLAVKILRPVQGVELRDVFEAEAAVHGALSRHPHIVTIHQVGWTVDGSRPFLVMDHVSGGSLADYVSRHGPVPWQHAVAWMIPVCSAVQHAHDHGILHRDLKPDNILLEPPGEPLLSDFGISCLRDDTSPLPALSIGHAAPEALRGERRGTGSDVYSLGSTIYHLLSGGLPFGADPFARIRNPDALPAPLPAERVPAWLDEAVRQAMAADPARRTSSARQLGRALEAGAGQVTLYPPTIVARSAPPVPASVDPRPPHPSVVSPLPPAHPWFAGAGAVEPDPGPSPSPSGPIPARGNQVEAAQSVTTQPPAAAPPVTVQPPERRAGEPAGRSSRGALVAALLSAVLAATAALTWARSEYLGAHDAGDGTAVAGPTATSPATQTVPATLGSEEADPASTDATATAATEPETAATAAPTPSPTPKPTSGPTATVPQDTGSTGSTDTTDPPPATVKVPDVSGQTKADATATLTGLGLTVDPASASDSSCTVGSGRVTKTNAPAGATVNKGETVKLTVSAGAPTAKVPAVVGKTEQEAKTALTNAGFTVSVKAVVLAKGNANIGKVTAQSVTSGTTASTCNAVVLTVGRQEPSLTTPTVTIGTVGGKVTGP